MTTTTNDPRYAPKTTYIVKLDDAGKVTSYEEHVSKAGAKKELQRLRAAFPYTNYRLVTEEELQKAEKTFSHSIDMEIF